MSVLVAFLAVTGALTWLAIIGGFIFGVFFRQASAEDRATVEVIDIDPAHFSQSLRRPTVTTTGRHLRVLGSGGWSTGHDPATCDACADLDRGGF